MTTLAELSASRELLTNLTQRELRGKYRASVVGWGWSLINPLATMLIFWFVFVVVFKQGVPESRSTGLQFFPLFFLCGLLPWNYTSIGFATSMQVLLSNANLVKKVYFPREVLVSSTVFAQTATLLIELGVLGVALLIAGNMVLPWLPVVLLLVVVQTAFVLGLSLAFSVLNVYFRDVQHFVSILLQLWFYATPVIYPITQVRDSSIADREVLGISLFDVYQANPMVSFVQSYRSLLYDLELPSWGHLTYATASALLVLAAGYAIFRRFEPRLAEEL